MRSKKGFYILLGVTVVMVAAAVVSQRSSNPPPSSHGLHAPELGSRAEAVRSVVIRSADMSLRVARTDQGWVARSKADYPADAGRIRRLVVGLSRLERLERKTSDPERHHRLELRDVDASGSKAVRVTLLSENGDALADILVGKTQDFQQDGRSRYFVRNAGDPQTWLVEGSLPPVLGDAGNWLDRALLPGVGDTGLQSISITHTDGGSVTVRRDPRGEGDFRLAGGTDGRETVRRPSVDAIARTLRGLSLEDVHAAEAPLEEEVATVEALTLNGVRIVARVGAADPGYELRLRAAYQPGRARNGDAEEAHGGEQLARALNARWGGRAFVVSRYALDGLLVRRADLVDTAKTPGAE